MGHIENVYIKFWVKAQMQARSFAPFHRSYYQFGSLGNVSYKLDLLNGGIEVLGSTNPMS